MSGRMIDRDSIAMAVLESMWEHDGVLYDPQFPDGFEDLVASERPASHARLAGKPWIRRLFRIGGDRLPPELWPDCIAYRVSVLDCVTLFVAHVGLSDSIRHARELADACRATQLDQSGA